MTSKKRVLAVALAGVLLLSSFAAAGMVSGATANDSLTVEVQATGNDGATVTVTQNDSAVANASVTVEASNGTYASTGNYTTDEDGTVSLPEPEQDVTVEVTAAKGNATGSATTMLRADEDTPKTFGQMISTFVQDMLNAGQDGGPIGQVISEFVTSNNPGADKKSDNAGKPADAGSQGNASAANGSAEDGNAANDSAEKGSQGPPEDAGNGKDKGNGNDKANSHGQNSDDEKTTTATTEE